VTIACQSRQERRSSWRTSQASETCAGAGATGAETLTRRLGEVALGYETSVGEHNDALGHALGDLQDMRGHDDGAAGANPRLQHVLDLAGGAGVKTGQRLVEDDEAGVVDERTGQRHLLAHAAREALATLVLVRPETKPVGKLAGGLAGGHRIDAPKTGDELEIFERRQLVVDHRLVGNPRHLALGGDRVGERVDAENIDRAGIGAEQADDHAQRRGLAGAVRPDESVELAGADRKVEVIDGGTIESLAEPAERKRRAGYCIH